MKNIKLLTILMAASMLASCAKSSDTTKKTKAERETTTTTTTAEETTSSETTEATTTTGTTTTGSTATAATSADSSWEGTHVDGFEGEWNRTNTHSSMAGIVTIDEVDEDSLHFVGEFYFFYHSGDAEGEAYFISENEAVYEDERGTITFTLEDGELSLVSEGNPGYMGNRVTTDGTYVIGEPAYTNRNVIAETFPNGENEEISEMLGEISDEVFLTPTYIGIVTEEDVTLSDGTSARHIECYVPTDTAGYDIIITEDGMIYFLSYGSAFVTNDTDYTSRELPAYTA